MERDAGLRSESVLRVAMIVAPLLLLASTIAYSLGGGLNGDATGGLIQIYAMALWALVVVGLVERFRLVFPRSALILTLLGIVGVLGGITYGFDAINTGLGNGETLENFEPEGILALQLPGALFPLSTLAIAVALFRAGVQPRWATVLLAIAAIMFPVSRVPSIEALAVAADALFVVALVTLARFPVPPQ